MQQLRHSMPTQGSSYGEWQGKKWRRRDRIGDDITSGAGIQAREEVDRAGRNRDRAPHGKNSHPGLLWVNAKSIMQNTWR